MISSAPLFGYFWWVFTPLFGNFFAHPPFALHPGQPPSLPCWHLHWHYRDNFCVYSVMKSTSLAVPALMIFGKMHFLVVSEYQKISFLWNKTWRDYKFSWNSYEKLGTVSGGFVEDLCHTCLNSSSLLKIEISWQIYIEKMMKDKSKLLLYKSHNLSSDLRLPNSKNKWLKFIIKITWWLSYLIDIFCCQIKFYMGVYIYI